MRICLKKIMDLPHREKKNKERGKGSSLCAGGGFAYF
jgi:hypothetical protein